MKVVEFQTEEGVETGMSAYFLRRDEWRDYGRVTSGNGAVRTADITFPVLSPTITVFLDRLRMSEGDVEIVLQALAEESRAFILSRPKITVVRGADTPAQITTGQKVPYEDTVVVGSTAVQTTKWIDTGVTLNITVPDIIDDDGDWVNTTDDQYINLKVDASVKELGTKIVVSLDDQLVGDTDNRIQVPEIVSRQIKTDVYVRHGQVLMLGGLFRNTKTKSLSTLPWLGTAEDMAVGMAERVIPGEFLASPVSSTLGNRAKSEGRRELVFFIKAESWQPTYTVTNEFGFDETEEDAIKKSFKDVITDVREGLSGISQDIAEGLAGEKNTGEVRESLGGRE